MESSGDSESRATQNDDEVSSLQDEPNEPPMRSNLITFLLIIFGTIIVCGIIKSITLRFIFMRVETVYFLMLLVLFYYYTEYMCGSVFPLVRNLAERDIMHSDQFERPKFLDLGFNDIEQRGMYWFFKHKNFSYCATQGQRTYMEDRMHYLFDPSMNLSVFGIFDGHGGQFVSDYLEEHFAKCIRKRLQKFASKRKVSMWTMKGRDPVEQAIVTEVLKIDDAISRLDPQQTAMCGSTLIAAIVEGNRFLTVVSVGDSRAVACAADGTACALSHDHKPTDPKERRRIEAAGGFITAYANDIERVQGILAVARSFGDTYLKRLGVLTAHPSTVRVDLKEQKFKFLIVATDGFWDVITTEESVKIAAKFLKSQKRGAWQSVAQHLVNAALVRGTLDNVSVLFLRFH